MFDLRFVVIEPTKNIKTNLFTITKYLNTIINLDLV